MGFLSHTNLHWPMQADKPKIGCYSMVHADKIMATYVWTPADMCNQNYNTWSRGIQTKHFARGYDLRRYPILKKN